jgi:hypothetical protein
MDDRMITSKAQTQHRKLSGRRPNLDVALTKRPQVIEAVRQTLHRYTPLNRMEQPRLR